MREKKIFDALTEVREEYIEEEEQQGSNSSSHLGGNGQLLLLRTGSHWHRWSTYAAAGSFVAMGSGGIGHGDSSIFMSYAGPVFL